MAWDGVAGPSGLFLCQDRKPGLQGAWDTPVTSHPVGKPAQPRPPSWGPPALPEVAVAGWLAAREGATGSWSPWKVSPS